MLITPPQLKYVNRKIIDLDYMTKLNRTLLSANDILAHDVELYEEKESQYKKQISSYEIASESYTTIINNKEAQIKDQIKKCKKEKTGTAIKAGIIGAIMGAIIISII